MTKILLSGCCGKMGRTVTNIVNTRNDCQIVAGVDIVEDSSLGYPVFQTFSEVQVKADVIIDFSNPALLSSMLDYAKSTNTAVVISTTGIIHQENALQAYLIAQMLEDSEKIQESRLYLPTDWRQKIRTNNWHPILKKAVETY